MDALTFLLLFLLSIACLALSTRSKEGKQPFLFAGGILLMLLGMLVIYEGLSFQQISTQARQISYFYPSNSTQSPSNHSSISTISYYVKHDYSTLLFSVMVILSGIYSMWMGVL